MQISRRDFSQDNSPLSLSHILSGCRAAALSSAPRSDQSARRPSQSRARVQSVHTIRLRHIAARVDLLCLLYIYRKYIHTYRLTAIGVIILHGIRPSSEWCCGDLKCAHTYVCIVIGAERIVERRERDVRTYGVTLLGSIYREIKLADAAGAVTTTRRTATVIASSHVS